jgi:hypothetical protein
MQEDREALYQRKGVDAPQCYQMRGGSADAVQTQLIGSPENDAMPQLILLMQRGDVADCWILNEVHEGSTVYQVQRRDPLPHVMKDDHQHRDQVTRQPRRRGSPGTSSGREDGVKLGTPVSSQPGVQFSGATAEGDPIQPTQEGTEDQTTECGRWQGADKKDLGKAFKVNEYSAPKGESEAQTQ